MPRPRKNKPDLTCSSCRKTFKRPEHFERHRRTHTREKPFACTWCNQSFSRFDSLTRHLASVHRRPGTDSPSVPVARRRRAIQACKPCARSKLRCDGNKPCHRCHERQISCFYERVPAGPTDGSGPAVSSRLPIQPPGPLESGVEGASMHPSDGLEGVEWTRLAQDHAGPDHANNHGNAHDVNLPSNLSFSPLDWIDFDAWFSMAPDNTYSASQALLDPDFAFLDGLQPPSLLQAVSPGMEIPGDQSSAPSSGAVDDIYRRRQVPEIDQDAIGPRTYDPVPVEEHKKLIFPDMSLVTDEDLEREDFAHVGTVPATVTEEVARFAQSIQSKSNYPDFVELRIPSSRLLSCWTQLYFEHFHPVFPILHKPTFSPSNANPFLVFTVAAIGAHFSRIKGSGLCLQAMHELIRRYTAYTCEKWNPTSRELWMSQAIILNQLGLMYSGNRRALELGETFQSVPVTLGRRKRLFSNIVPRGSAREMQHPLETEWRLWILDEQRRRAGFAIWLIDLAYDHHFDLSHILRVEELQNCLPQGEPRWDAPSTQSWTGHTETNVTLPPLFQVAAHPALVANWAEIGTLGKQAVLQHLANVIGVRPRPPGVPSFLPDERHATARKLDELLNEGSCHRSISEVKASIVHEIMTMTALMSYHTPSLDLISTAFKVIYGQVNDEFRARVADTWLAFPNQGREGVIFAARILEKVRSNHCTHFSTPNSLLRAILVLWVYSTVFGELGTPPLGDRAIPSIVLDPTITDSALLSQWIHHGSRRVKLPGIGDILHSEGRSKMLKETLVIMKSLNAWGISGIYAELLARLRKINNW